MPSGLGVTSWSVASGAHHTACILAFDDNVTLPDLPAHRPAAAIMAYFSVTAAITHFVSDRITGPGSTARYCGSAGEPILAKRLDMFIN